MSSQSHPPEGPQLPRGAQTLRNAGRRGTGTVFAILITVLLVAAIFAANQNEIIGWILVVISAMWLLLAAIVTFVIWRGAAKVGLAADSTRTAVDAARAAAAARSSDSSGGTVVIDEDTHSRNMKLDHSLKIVQVQKRVVAEELAKGEAADQEMVNRALDTIDITAHNGRDMLAEVLGKTKDGTTDHQEG